MSKILIGSNNPHKLADWQAFIGADYTVVSPADLKLDMEVPEGMSSVAENSLAKARAWCRASGLPTIADDTGFFVNALHGRPGVAVKRWGGALPESTTDEELFAYMRQQVEPLEDTSCYFETVLSIALPSGETHQIVHRTIGKIDKDLLRAGFKKGSFPLGLVFKKDGRNKVWNDMTDEEKRKSDESLVRQARLILRQAKSAGKV